MDKDEKQDQFDSAGETRGYISMDQVRISAIQHARDNTDFYDPSIRYEPLVWEVIDQRETEDFYEIRLSFRPARRFQGEPGIEQFTIDKTGKIELRQIVRELVREPVSEPIREPVREPVRERVSSEAQPRTAPQYKWNRGIWVGLGLLAAVIISAVIIVNLDNGEEDEEVAVLQAPFATEKPAAVALISDPANSLVFAYDGWTGTYLPMYVLNPNPPKDGLGASP